MTLMIQPNQICLIVKLYNIRPELLPDSNDANYKSQECFVNNIIITKQAPPKGVCLLLT